MNKLINTFGRRIGKSLSGTNRKLISEILPKFAFSEDEVKAPITLEIGFGTGNFLMQYAINNPAKLCIGCEPFLNGVAQLTKNIIAENISNIRIWPDDVRLLFSKLPLLDEVFILFPDPWPKRKQHQRRLVNKEFLALLATKLKPGGKLNIVTDHIDYAKWILKAVSNHPDYKWQENYISYTDVAFPYVNVTRYYQKAADVDAKPRFFKLQRV